MQDKDFLAAAQKAKIDVGYLSAGEVHKMFATLLEQPPEVQKEIVKYIKFGS